MSLSATALLLVILLLVWLFIRHRASSAARKPEPPTTARRKNTAYHAVSIHYASNACMAAREMEGRRFLATAAPRLPLPGCNVLECSCRFVHHEDRRTGKDRRSPFGPGGFGGGTGSFETEKRQGGDRRRRRDDDDY